MSDAFYTIGNEVYAVIVKTGVGPGISALICTACSEISAQNIASLLQKESLKVQRAETPSAFGPSAFSTGLISANSAVSVFTSQINTAVDLGALQASWSLPSNMSIKDSFPISTQTVPVLIVDDTQQVKSDLNMIKHACREEGYGLDAVARLEKILTQPNATSQIVWAKREEIEHAKQFGGSFNVWITRYSDLDTAMLLPPQEMIQNISSLERAQKKKIDYPPPM